MSVAWKNLERKIAKKLGGKRITRGGDFSVSDLDVEHPHFSIEAKYRQKWSFIKHYDKLIADTKRLYKENKVPLLIVKKAKRHGEFVILSLDDFIDLIKDDFKE